MEWRNRFQSLPISQNQKIKHVFGVESVILKEIQLAIETVELLLINVVENNSKRCYIYTRPNFTKQMESALLKQIGKKIDRM